MKKLTLALIAASLLGCATPPSQIPVTVKESTDKYTGISELATSEIKLSYSRSLKIAKFEDKSTNGLSAVLFTYIKNGAYDTTHGREWQYLSSKRGYLMLNGKPVQLGEGNHHGYPRKSIGGFYLDETVSFIIKPEMIGRLVSARTIAGRVGESEFSLTPEQVKSVNEFALKAI